ncbi:RapZ C-terminal domain-containing protein [Plebeiibacterium marinum]|uniref:Phosphotransferase n=1 Tax=Plebeiibacterium marinum TaxID=2992111 RepID=A0AAE3MBL9_9BACT|nr:RNase adapter RapZ [Plebeiobacterium marinum]MCW3804733.1 phosphotransferase [Plebeiobacterium marinum]
MNIEKQQLIMKMFTQWSGEKVESMTMLPPSGSYREYVRIEGGGKSALGVYNADEKENKAFVEFTKHFLSKGLNVPNIYDENLGEDVYLIEDLGNVTLFDFLQENRTAESLSPALVELYQKTIKELVCFQLKGSEGLGFDLCYPRKAFDRQSMLWDLHYFKYYFLKLAQVPFDEQALEDDFSKLIDFLLEAEHHYFLYRDFQSRNVMIKQGEPWFIDYQGGRKGALQYDLASLLYDGKADIPPVVREELYRYYIEELKKYKEVDEDTFQHHFSGYVYIRIMQAMGAYGFRGFYEKKEHFLKSIPFALQNISYLLRSHPLPLDIPELNKVLNALTQNEKLKKINALTVTVNSFSYKRGIPYDMSGNGGGFVFDCRAIHNPGRYAEYKHITGKDKPVIEFLEKEPEMKQFLDTVFPLVSQSVEKYIERNFKHLMVNFGCTGGQHRSVYSAERLAEYIRTKYPVSVKLRHIEQEIKKG